MLETHNSRGSAFVKKFVFENVSLCVDADRTKYLYINRLKGSFGRKLMYLANGQIVTMLPKTAVINTLEQMSAAYL